MTRESPEARAERILAELRAATSEAAGVLKDLNAAAKAARIQCEGYVHDEVQQALDNYKGQIEANGLRLMKQCVTELNRVSANAVTRATETVEAATTIDVLAAAVAREIARRTEYVNGQPEITWGYGTDPDALDFKD